MIIQNLNFFDKFGRNLNLNYNTDLAIWQGTIYFEGISLYLFDNENLFILEKDGSDYKFPILEYGQSLEFSWSSNKFQDEFFIYNVERDLQIKELFISKVDSKTISHSDINPPSNTSPLNIKTPLQLNIAFSPTDEVKFERTLNIYSIESSVKTKIAEINLYGEGVEEEERFKTWAQNFGIKFLKEDANILKDYDIKEAFPDHTALNQIRKELLVNKDQIYPYIGTYKGLSNFINILGYKDTLQVKEYWKNINPKSSYFNKMLMVDISDYLDDGKIDTFDLVDRNSNIKSGKQFKKTEFLAIAYQFTRATDNYDDDGIPIVEETTEFTVNEIFYKLNLLNDKLKNEFLPVNVKIKDIIGEFVYFQKFTIKYWPDNTLIYDYDLNESADISIYPDQNVNLVLRSLDPLYRKVNPNGLDLGVGLINTDSAKNPFEVNQKYSKDEIVKVAAHIEEFYNQIRDQRFPNLGQTLTWETGDDSQKSIGAPTIFTIDTGLFTVGDLKGVKLEDLDSQIAGVDPYWTLENINYRNFYEIVWKITKGAPNPYSFEYRGKVSDLYKLPHFLPYAGKYRVTAELYDFYGNASAFSRFVTVASDLNPKIIGFTRLEDKFNYKISNLSNVQLQDFGASFVFYPKVNVLDSDETVASLGIYKNLLEWDAFYQNTYGLGQNLYDVELYNQSTNTYIPYTSPYQTHPKKLYWGLGENDTPIKLSDFNDVQIEDLFWMRIGNLAYTADFNAGFYLTNPLAGETIKISEFLDYTIPSFIDIDDLVNTLNASTDPGIELFTYAQLGNGLSVAHLAGDVDPAFNIGTGFNSDVNTVVVQSDDKIVVGGYFTQYDGSSYNSIARLNSDGTLDLTFIVGTGFNDPFNTIVYEIIVLPDGKLLVGGNFTEYNGTPCNNIIKLNLDGSIDTSFVIGTGFDNTVLTFALQSNGKILVGGNFTQYNGNSYSGIIRLNLDGSIDPSFVIGTGSNGSIYTISVYPDGKIVISGNVTDYNGTPCMFIIRLNSDGSIDPSFVTGTGFDGSALISKLQDDGKLLVAGSFNNYNGNTYDGIVRLNSDGSADTSFIIGTGLNSPAFMFAIEIQSDDKILVGGVFNSYDGNSYNNIVRLNSDGSADTTFNIGTGFDSSANSFNLLPDDTILIGGGFTTYQGNTNNRLIKLYSTATPKIIHATAKYLSKEPYHILEASGSVEIDKYSFFLPKKVYSKPLVNYLKAQYPNFDDETLFLHAKTSDVLSGAVQDPNYWITNKYWNFTNNEQTGFLPTVLDQNAFNIADIKAFENSFSVPENAILFFVVNNLDGKNEFVWTLTDSVTGEEVVRAKTVPFFVWKFKDIGIFTLSVTVTDNRGTDYTSTIQNFIKVLDKKQYGREVETRLDLRKIELIKNPL